jgi:hypothetical protein
MRRPDFHKKLRRSKGLIVRRAFGAPGQTPQVPAAARTQICSRLLIFL